MDYRVIALFIDCIILAVLAVVVIFMAIFGGNVFIFRTVSILLVLCGISALIIAIPYVLEIIGERLWKKEIFILNKNGYLKLSK